MSDEEAYNLWLEDDSPVLSFSECPICKAEGYPGQRGHSATSCLADRLREEATDLIETSGTSMRTTDLPQASSEKLREPME